MGRTTKAGVVLAMSALGCAGRPDAKLGDRSAPRAITIDLSAEPDDRRLCGRCHRAIVEEWAASAHSTAFSDPVFQAGYAVDHQPECRACHAPLSPGDRDPAPGSVAAEVGVACRVCHAEAGAITGPEGRRAHGGPVRSGWGTAEVCRSCHQFTFPEATPSRRAVFDPHEWMQRTFAEWEASGSSRTCQDCHMPWRKDERGHRYRGHEMMLGIHDVEAMAEAVRVQVRAEVDERSTVVKVVISVDLERLAHAFPTGDMFRSAELEVWPAQQPSAVQTVVMRREFGPAARPDERGITRIRMVEVGDTRPRPGHPVRRTLGWADPHRELIWRLSHLRMDAGRAAREGVLESANRRVVAQGRVVARGRATESLGSAVR